MGLCESNHWGKRKGSKHKSCHWYVWWAAKRPVCHARGPWGFVSVFVTHQEIIGGWGKKVCITWSGVLFFKDLSGFWEDIGF